MARLTHRAQFDAVLAYDNAVTGHRFVVRAKPNGMINARLGMIMGRKGIPRAVDRNRCKRLVREVFRATEPILAALDVVVLCRSAVTRREKAAGRQELVGLFAAVSEHGGTRPAARER